MGKRAKKIRTKFTEKQLEERHDRAFAKHEKRAKRYYDALRESGNITEKDLRLIVNTRA